MGAFVESPWQQGEQGEFGPCYVRFVEGQLVIGNALQVQVQNGAIVASLDRPLSFCLAKLTPK